VATRSPLTRIGAGISRATAATGRARRGWSAPVRRLRARARLRRVNASRVQRALHVPIPSVDPTVADPYVDRRTTYGSPRTLLYVTVKRDNTSWRSPYGHWWLELDEGESYGWWPGMVPLGVIDILRGTSGVLNGAGLLGLKGTWHRDPNHGHRAMHAFHPVLMKVKTDEQVRTEIRSFAHGYRAPWRWHWTSERTSGTCRTFQDELFASVGLHEGWDRLHTRGSGCPFLYHFRRPQWWLADRLDEAFLTLSTGATRRPKASKASTDHHDDDDLPARGRSSLNRDGLTRRRRDRPAAP
jgi:hypothetical protein